MTPSNDNNGKDKTITSANDDEKVSANDKKKAPGEGKPANEIGKVSASALVSAWWTKHIHNSAIARNVRLYNALRTEIPVLIQRLDAVKTDAQFREAVNEWMRTRIEGGPIGRNAVAMRTLQNAILKLQLKG